MASERLLTDGEIDTALWAMVRADEGRSAPMFGATLVGGDMVSIAIPDGDKPDGIMELWAVATLAPNAGED